MKMLSSASIHPEANGLVARQAEIDYNLIRHSIRHQMTTINMQRLRIALIVGIQRLMNSTELVILRECCVDVRVKGLVSYCADIVSRIHTESQ